MPERALIRHPAANEATAYIVEQGGNELAHQFLDDVEHAFARLRRFPHIGRPWPTRNPALSGLRRWPVPNFPLSIFYQLTKSAIEVVPACCTTHATSRRSSTICSASFVDDGYW